MAARDRSHAEGMKTPEAEQLMTAQQTRTEPVRRHTSTSTGTRTGADGTAGTEPFDAAADRALKDKHRALWGLGDYAAVARDLVGTLGPAVVQACGVSADHRVLDVAAGTGNAAIPAARTGATVVAADLSPELLRTGSRLASEQGVYLDWVEADAEALPFDASDFDVVVSVVGVMFAPHHRRAAGELLRVLRPGGRLGLVSWTPEGFIGRMFATMKPYAAPPPPGVQPPPLWGDPDRVRGLLGDAVTDLTATRHLLPVDAFGDGEAFRDYFKATYGPTIAAYRAIAGEPERVAALDRELAALGDAAIGDHTMEWEYLLVTATRAG